MVGSAGNRAVNRWWLATGRTQGGGTRVYIRWTADAIWILGPPSMGGRGRASGRDRRCDSSDHLVRRRRFRRWRLLAHGGCGARRLLIDRNLDSAGGRECTGTDTWDRVQSAKRFVACTRSPSVVSAPPWSSSSTICKVASGSCCARRQITPSGEAMSRRPRTNTAGTPVMRSARPLMPSGGRNA
jgi:hypothetical protein